MKKFTHNFISLVSALIILAFIAYGIFWAVVAREMNRHVADIWNNQDRFQIVIDGERPAVTGFPAPPKLVFSGSLTDRNGMIYAAPEAVYQGFPLPGLPMTFTTPQGMDFSGPVLRQPVHLDYFLLSVRIPRDLPPEFDRASLHVWQQAGGALPVEDLRVRRASLNLSGTGYLNLDNDLQPSGLITTKLSGLDDLLNEFTANGTIGEKQAMMAQSLLNLMAQKDPATGDMTITTGVRIQSGGVFLGPLRVASLPKWRWDKAP